MPTCALCTDSDATERLESPGVLAALLVQETRLDIYEGAVVIPVCEPCEQRLTDALDAYRYPDGPDDRAYAGQRLTRLARELNVSVIADASG